MLDNARKPRWTDGMGSAMSDQSGGAHCSVGCSIVERVRCKLMLWLQEIQMLLMLFFNDLSGIKSRVASILSKSKIKMQSVVHLYSDVNQLLATMVKTEEKVDNTEGSDDKALIPCSKGITVTFSRRPYLRIKIQWINLHLITDVRSITRSIVQGKNWLERHMYSHVRRVPQLCDGMGYSLQALKMFVAKVNFGSYWGWGVYLVCIFCWL